MRSAGHDTDLSGLGDHGGRARFRDHLLDLARAAVSRCEQDGLEPDSCALHILEAWVAAGLPADSADAAFGLDLRSGVEALVFVVEPTFGAGDGSSPSDAARLTAGMVLRFPREFPDSYERLDGSAASSAGDGAAALDAVRRAFFGSADAR